MNPVVEIIIYYANIFFCFKTGCKWNVTVFFENWGFFIIFDIIIQILRKICNASQYIINSGYFNILFSYYFINIIGDIFYHYKSLLNSIIYFQMFKYFHIFINDILINLFIYTYSISINLTSYFFFKINIHSIVANFFIIIWLIRKETTNKLF